MYPRKYSQEIVELFLGTLPRAWSELSRTFYIREEHIVTIFQRDQFLWNKIKYYLKKIDRVAVKYPDRHINLEVWTKNNPEIRLFIKRIFAYDLYSDDMDFILYPHA